MTPPDPDHTPESKADVADGQRDEEATYHIRNDESVTEGVVRAVSSATHSEPIELEPLYSVVDTDALNALFTSLGTGTSRHSNGVVEFDYAGNRIQVTSSGSIEIETETPGDASRLDV